MKRVARAALTLALLSCGRIEQQVTATSPGDCQTYCGVTFLNCRRANTLYTQFGDCMTACNGFPTDGKLGDISGNTLQCRLTFAVAAENDPVPFCRNASQSGGPACQ